MNSDKFDYPRLTVDILIIVKNKMFEIIFKEILDELINSQSIRIKVVLQEKKGQLYSHEWIRKESIVTIYFSKSFIIDHVNKSSESYISFLSKFPIKHQLFTTFLESFKQLHEKSKYPFILLNVFFKSEKRYVFQFIHYFENLKNETYSMRDVLDLIVDFEILNDVKLNSIIKNTISQIDRIKYFEFIDNNWTILNPLIRISERVNLDYQKGKDYRIRKPSVILNKNDFKKKLVLESNWILSTGDVDILMVQPNDVSIYCNISKTLLDKGWEFYKENISNLSSNYPSEFPSLEKQKKYFDYFETMIVSIIFSFTSIETLVNICIPFKYNYFNKKTGQLETIFKPKIEKSFTLRDKIKCVLKDV